MRGTLTHKILEKHVVEGELKAGQPIGIRIDQTLTQDATGTTAFLLFESMGVKRVKTDVSVSYIDHNMSQFGPENHNDHLYLQTVSTKAGCYHSRPGNGICHQVHLERFGVPGSTLLGSDSHTPTNGGIGMIAIGAGGMDVAVAMGGGPFYLSAPKVIGVHVTGSLNPWVASKDIILKLLSILTTKGNVGCVVEYFGSGVGTLSVPQRATVTNMGAELGVTTSIFPSDERTELFLKAQGREEAFTPMSADADAEYDEVIEIHLDELEPMAACPSSPDNIKTVAELEGMDVRQVIVGSCTNSSYTDLMMVARTLKGQKVHRLVEFAISPGSKQVLEMIAENGALADIIGAGARILESGCGPCIGQGFSPASDVVTLRTFNRNFAGRTGSPCDQAYLISPETAVAAALTGRITDPRKISEMYEQDYPVPEMPEQFKIDDSMLEKPLSIADAEKAEVLRGPTIVVPESSKPLADELVGQVLVKVGDKITTDHIMPAGAFLKYRSNVPEYAKVVFNCFNEEDRDSFADRALKLKREGIAGIIVSAESYGQGSSREHAALCPMYLGVRAVIAKSIERIHKANLINFAILPIEFDNAADYEKISSDDQLKIENVNDCIAKSETIMVTNHTTGESYTCKLILSDRDRQILLAGGLLNYTKTH